MYHIWPRTTTYGLDSVSYLALELPHMDLIVYHIWQLHMDLIVYHIWPRTTTYGLDSIIFGFELPY